MAFTCTSETKNSIAVLTLDGELDAAAANAFRLEIEKAAASHCKRLVLLVTNLSYMASAGLRALVFAKQKMGPNVDIYVVGVQDPVRETLEMTGFQHSVILLEQYDAAEIEAI